MLTVIGAAGRPVESETECPLWADTRVKGVTTIATVRHGTGRQAGAGALGVVASPSPRRGFRSFALAEGHLHPMYGRNSWHSVPMASSAVGHPRRAAGHRPHTRSVRRDRAGR